MRMLRSLSIVAVTYGAAMFGSNALAQNQASVAAAQELITSSAVASSNCVPGIDVALRGRYAVQYRTLLAAIAPNTVDLAQLLDAVENVASYNELLEFSTNLARSTPNGRLLIALPDGTVVIDTAEPVDLANTLPQGNSYQHYVNKTVNENHNSRVAIISAQQYPCGLGVESKLSTTTGSFQSYVALRLGTHLESSGTARISVVTTSALQ